MPEYLTPGVYIEEFERGIKPIEGVSTSTAGFLGFTERGPTNSPKLVTSLAKFMRIYGNHVFDSYLAYAVEGFFTNGGKRCYIGRIVFDGAEPANTELGDITFTAVGEGIWGNRIGLKVDDASNDVDPENHPQPEGKKTFKLIVAYWSKESTKGDIDKANVFEVFDDLSEDPDSPDHYLKKLNDPLNNLSNLVVIDGTGRPDNTDAFQFLDEGVDANTDPPRATPDNFRGKPDALPGDKRGLTAFSEIDDIQIICVPDLHLIEEEDSRKALNGFILAQCQDLKDRFAILDIHMNKKDYSKLTITAEATSSKYGAIYYPWIKVYDSLTKQQRMIPPGGHIAGIYARSDTERGVHKAPANEVVRGALDLEFILTKDDQATLNPRGINVIRFFPGRGFLVWGARTCILDALWKYINVRRLFIYVEESIEEGTQWVVFEPNDEKLWARVKASISAFITSVWRDGALMGTKPDEAFYVKCDRSTMTQDDIDNGKLICEIGIAPVKPAEFVIIRIEQWTGGSSITE